MFIIIQTVFVSERYSINWVMIVYYKILCLVYYWWYWRWRKEFFWFFYVIPFCIPCFRFFARSDNFILSRSVLFLYMCVICNIDESFHLYSKVLSQRVCNCICAIQNINQIDASYFIANMQVNRNRNTKIMLNFRFYFKIITWALR